ncbi:MAG: cobalamin-binding protein [Leptolyngbya sp. RL_3_1]|nr:cobalamin-binding protein [Leptolyngbya sp. RL_3_1]
MNIVTLLPSATEIVCALGLQASLVAVSHECDFPPEVTALPKITRSSIPHPLSAGQIDQAVVAAIQRGEALYQVDGDLLQRLQPDLIVTQGLCDVCAVNVDTVQATMMFLPDFVAETVQVLSLSAQNFAGILRDLDQVAQATDSAPMAAQLREALEHRWQKLQTTQPTLKPRVLMLEWPDPFFYGGHWVPEMVAVAGGIDVMGQVGRDSGRCTLADIQAQDPDVIISMACGYGLAGNIEFAQQLAAQPGFGALRAVQNHQLWAMDANSYCSRPAPRIVDGAEKLQAIFNHAGQGVSGIARL